MRLFLLAVIAAGCGEVIDNEAENKKHRGIDDDPPSDHAIEARIRGDLRDTWLPDPEKGTSAAAGITYHGIKPFCSTCRGGPPMKVFTLRADPADRQFPVRETAYFCPAESAYWYHYEGGPLRRDAWLGPRRIAIQDPTKR